MTLEQFSAHLKSVLLKKISGFGENCGISLLFFHKTYEPLHEKTNFLASDLFRHKPDCTATEDG